MEKKQGALGRFEDYLLARGRKSAGRYLQVAQRFLEANPGEEEPFEARHVNRFLASLSRGGAQARTLWWNYYVVKSFFHALGHPSVRSLWDRGGHRVPSHRHCPTTGLDILGEGAVAFHMTRLIMG